MRPCSEAIPLPACPPLQVRLVRTQGFITPDMEVKRGGAEDDDDDYMDPGAAFL